MCNDSRLFNCARCHKQIIICRHCDRGQIYCAEGCAEISRQVAVNSASTRYQNTRRGKHHHAARQRQYRQRQQANNKKVTHHSSAANSSRDVLTTSQAKIETLKLACEINNSNLHCHFCKKPVSDFLRTTFLVPVNRYPQLSMLKVT